MDPRKAPAIIEIAGAILLSEGFKSLRGVTFSANPTSTKRNRGTVTQVIADGASDRGAAATIGPVISTVRKPS